MNIDKKKKQSQQTVQQAQQWPRNNRKNNNNNTNNNSWADKDVSSYQEIEFDFQKNLNRFDKAKVFAEIRVKKKKKKRLCTN